MLWRPTLPIRKTAARAEWVDSYRPDIDGLRAFAVFAVVLYHAFPNWVPGGYVGVDVFFVISGFLISSILLNEIGAGTFSFRTFYARRSRRLFPALSICLAAVLAYGFVCLLPSELMQLGKHVFFGAVFLSNIATWSEAGYFEIAATLKPLLHLWSLGIEEQFYIFWPALLWMAIRQKAVWPVVAALFLVSFLANVWLSATNIAADFFLPASRLWEFLGGTMLALRRQTVLASSVRSWTSLTGFAALFASVVLFKTELRFPGWWALLPVGGTMALIAAGPEALVNRHVLSHRSVVFVGLISYPLYLWHWPLISYAYILRLGRTPTPLMATVLVAASFLLAWATYSFIERPVRFGMHRQRRTRIAVASMVAVGACGLVVWIENGFPDRFPSLPSLDTRKISEARLDPVFQPTKGMDVQSLDGTLVAHLGSGERKVALSGDSLLFQYGPRMQELSDEGQLTANIYFVTGGSCAPLPGIVQWNDFAHCANMPGILIDLIKRQKIRSVVLGASWAGYGGELIRIERDGRRLSLGTPEGQAAFYANLEDYVRLIMNQGAKVYLVRGVPVHHTRFNPTAMVVRSPTSFRIAPDVDQDVPVAELRAPYAIIDEKLRAVAEHTGAEVLDAFPDICGDGDGCSPFFAMAEPKYSDGVHLRPAFVRKNIHFLDFLLK